METVKTVHRKLRTELTNYIKAQYIRKNTFLLSALENELDKRNVLWQQPYIEMPASYEIFESGIKNLNLPQWVKKFLGELAEHGLGVYQTPYVHQAQALEKAYAGSDLFVSTGTGSGKTECFMWPLIAKLTTEAKEKTYSWNTRGVRAIIMYPMNALVADQIGRLRRIIGTDDFLHIFRNTTNSEIRRPQFGMYTGRTPYPGSDTNKNSDKDLANSLLHLQKGDSLSEEIYAKLLQEGRIPAKKDLKQFIDDLQKNQHNTDFDDAELITRFEMQKHCPDILITNYSMLEYMLLRPIEAPIWNTTKEWLNAAPENKLLFVIDEAHMYRGASGGEVALLLRRLMHKLNISRDKIQFILTTASMPYETEADKRSVSLFAQNLTSANTDEFFYIFGTQRSELKKSGLNRLDINRFMQWDYSSQSTDDNLLVNLNKFWQGLAPQFTSLSQAQSWLYDNIKNYDLFNSLVSMCSGFACSIDEIAKTLFGSLSEADAQKACYNALDIAACAVNGSGETLLPIRLHMLFRGIKGIYACANPHCSCGHNHDGYKLGQIFLNDSYFTCPECGGMVYELINDRRCGSLFFKGYITVDANNKPAEKTFLWRNPGLYFDKTMHEIHLFIPKTGKKYAKSGEHPIQVCYLDAQSGFLYFDDDSVRERENVIKLYYSLYTEKRRPEVFTFASCPKCRHQLSRLQLTSFATKSNYPFYNLVKAQFNVQPPVPNKQDRAKYPNQGRKVLLFSDSRQRAAKLALDMSNASDEMAFMQLFMLAVQAIEKTGKEVSLDDLYGYLVQEAALRGVQLFHNESREKFLDNCQSTLKDIARRTKRGRTFEPDISFENAPNAALEHLIRLFCAGYNNVYDNALAWLEPTKNYLEKAIYTLQDNNIDVDEEKFIEVFNAWLMDIFNKYGALGYRIDDECRKAVLSSYKRLGLEQNWKFAKTFLKNMAWEKNPNMVQIWHEALQDFLDGSGDQYYIQLKKIVVKDGLQHEWYKCCSCSELTAFPLNGKCPTCGSDDLAKMTEQEYAALDFWRTPILDSRTGQNIHVLDTEEHTAQLSHSDKRDNLWSKTEQYEMRFQDLLQGNEMPVDILSCTTTMEVGIDIGSLVAVGLRNVPPMRENYQQRAGRAGRRNASLSTIVTYCEDGAHDSMYFANPADMFRGTPRQPWIDVDSKKLIMRHMNLILLQSFLNTIHESLDKIETISFCQDNLLAAKKYIENYSDYKEGILVKQCSYEFIQEHKVQLIEALNNLKEKTEKHPELFEKSFSKTAKSLLDALYEEGIIPSYSFPKNLTSVYINDSKGNPDFQIERGLDVAIGEYAPGRSIVVDKNLYQIGGLYVSGSEKRDRILPAKPFMEDANYVKQIFFCPNCNWFGLADDLRNGKCPLCGHATNQDKEMVRPWGFAPVNAKSMNRTELTETYTYPEAPEYSAAPSSNDLQSIKNFKNARIAIRDNQRIIMRNKGENGKGFMICPDCGAAAPGEDMNAFKLDRGIEINRPYNLDYLKYKCSHKNAQNYTLGFDFITDMFVLEIPLDSEVINVGHNSNLWIERAARSFAEGLRLQASKILDVEFTELNAGYRLRYTQQNLVYVDIYLYDSLSSGAGYSTGLSGQINNLLQNLEKFFLECNCNNACQNCLKHYRNQNYHAMLDRFAALDLLYWAKTGAVHALFSMDEQWKMILPLKNILQDYGIDIKMSNNKIIAAFAGQELELKILPSMLNKPNSMGVILVNDFDLKYSRAYAVDFIRHSFVTKI